MTAGNVHRLIAAAGVSLILVAGIFRPELWPAILSSAAIVALSQTLILFGDRLTYLKQPVWLRLGFKFGMLGGGVAHSVCPDQLYANLVLAGFAMVGLAEWLAIERILLNEPTEVKQRRDWKRRLNQRKIARWNGTLLVVFGIVLLATAATRLGQAVDAAGLAACGFLTMVVGAVSIWVGTASRAGQHTNTGRDQRSRSAQGHR